MTARRFISLLPVPGLPSTPTNRSSMTPESARIFAGFGPSEHFWHLRAKGATSNVTMNKRRVNAAAMLRRRAHLPINGAREVSVRRHGRRGTDKRDAAPHLRDIAHLIRAEQSQCSGAGYIANCNRRTSPAAVTDPLLATLHAVLLPVRTPCSQAPAVGVLFYLLKLTPIPPDAPAPRSCLPATCPSA